MSAPVVRAGRPFAVRDCPVRDWPWQDWPWQDWAAPAGRRVVAGAGFDTGRERAALAESRRSGVPVLSVRLRAGEILVGPLWTADSGTGCAGCAEAADRLRCRAEEDRFEADRAERASVGAAAFGDPRPAVPAPWLAEVVAVAVADPTLAPGELVAISGSGGVSRHRVPRTVRCPVCGERETLVLDRPGPPPPRWAAQPRPTTAAMPTRAADPPFGMDAREARRRAADARFGPVVRLTRHSRGAFPISEAELLVGTPAGLGRAGSHGEAEVIAVLEAHERAAGYPHHAPILVGATRRELGGLALDPRRLGGYTARQLADPSCRVTAYTDDLPMDWVWAAPLSGARPLLVPAEVGYFRYRYAAHPLRGASDAAPRRNVFLESSSGSALGASVEEAALHSLLELAERDAFLLAWHRGRPLPRIDPASVRDPESRFLLRLAEEHGYRVFLLRATADIDVPVVWALAVRPDGGLGASYSTAGCHPDPAVAVRAALWELSQLVSGGIGWDVEEIRPLVADPWQVRTIAQHWRRYAFPELLPVVERVLGGELTGLADAFPGWPRRFVDAARGDVTGALAELAGRFAAAGLAEILLVDQSGPEQAALGLHVVKCVVPGIVPMCFGHAHQRVTGLPRLAAGLGRTDEPPYDPHPFP